MDVAHDGLSVSSLMDGELNLDEAEREIARLKTDTSLRASWDTYHLIGDTLRGDTVVDAGVAGFAGRFAERLAAEPTVLAPPRRAPRSRFQTYALSAAASVAAVAVVGWVTMSTLVVKPDTAAGILATAPLVQPVPSQPLAPQPQVAATPPAPAQQAPIAAVQPAPVPAAVLASPEHVHEYMLAHQGISPTTAIQGVAPYIRTVSSVGE
jgi:sigma-E factor negative regulatory protein RseA